MRRTLNILFATLALVFGGFSLALLFLLVPLLFWILLAAYSAKFSLQVWTWQKSKARTPTERFDGLHFFNFNRALSAWIEWLVILFAFAGTLVWIKVLAPIIF